MLLAGCYGTTGSPYSNGEVYTTGQPGYPYGQPVYSNGGAVYPGGQPVYSNAPVYTDPYGQAPDDYVYYPDAGVYYSTTHHDYIYPEGGRWIRRYDPPRVSEWGPSVHLWFHDAPERHHEDVIRNYPQNWRPDRYQRDHDHNRRDRDDDDDRR